METRKQETKKSDLSFQRQKRFLLMVPVLIIPFLTGAFWALGGGRGTTALTSPAVGQHGFNTNLPQPHFDKKESMMDKLGFYAKAAQDSASLAEKQKGDPYLAARKGDPVSKGFGGFKGAMNGSPENSTLTYSGAMGKGVDPNEEKVAAKLDQLKKIINQPAYSNPMEGAENATGTGYPSPMHASPEIERLEKVMNSMKQANDSAGHDPEMDRINSMLDKVLQIQHPEMVASAGNKPNETGPGNPPVSDNKEGTIETLGATRSVPGDTGKANFREAEDDFFAFDDNDPVKREVNNTIRAVISEDQTLVSGATIKLRLLEDVKLGGVVIPKDNFIYGTATLSNERLLIGIKSVIYQNSIYPASWQVYDLDGMAGIFIPGAIGRDVSKESAADGISGVGLSTYDPSFGGQAATAGIQAAKTLITRKVRLVRVSVKAGYEVLLKEGRSSN